MTSHRSRAVLRSLAADGFLEGVGVSCVKAIETLPDDLSPVARRELRRADSSG